MKRSADWIRCIVIAIPARDEEERVGACLRSVLAAADRVGPGIDVTVVVAADSCVDDTAVVAGLFATNDARLHVVAGEWRSAGGARAAAVEHGLDAASRGNELRGGSTWIATTDADTVVGDDWLRCHLHHADRGAHAIAGIVDLLDDVDRTALVLDTFTELYGLGVENHPHVHGANLGIRADAYLAAGGFADISVSEDQMLWATVNRLGFRCVSPLDVTVSTSARLRGRAVGGFADTIAAAVGL